MTLASPMRRCAGVAAAPGLGVGEAHYLGGRVEVQQRRILVEEIEAELLRFSEALVRADGQLASIQDQIAAREPEGQHYRILEAHRMMLTDVHLVEETRRIVREERVGAECGVRRALDQIQAVLSRIEDPYFRDRRSDVDMVGEYILRNLMGIEVSTHEAVPSGAVVFAHDVSPADITQLARVGVAGIFTEGGGKTSHSAVLARAYGLPYVVGVQDCFSHIRSGIKVIVDGGRGEVILDPDARAVTAYNARAERQAARGKRLAASRGEPAITRDGHRVHLAANVELTEEVETALDIGAESIGLFRTEFLYLERADLPTEDEHYAHAVAALKALGGTGARFVTFRTLDLGGDKLPASVRMPAGHNPALGLRSIRYSLRRKDLFRAQLRAFYRAAAVAPLRILFPMISGVAELREAKQVCAEVCRDLHAEGVEHNAFVPLGVMVETPSAAAIADLLASECEFLTIGTNDLIQYALAADRQDEHVGYLYHPLHPAILRLLRQVVLAAQRAGKPLAMCGDMAGDPLLTWVLIGLGLRDLSMAPRQIPIVKSIIRATSLAEAEQLCETIASFRTESEIEDVVHKVMRERYPAELDEESQEDDDAAAFGSTEDAPSATLD
jgi:phosphoenolpyruvate-protein phosphotransferase (PTS system enzyme I)